MHGSARLGLAAITCSIAIGLGPPMALATQHPAGLAPGSTLKGISDLDDVSADAVDDAWAVGLTTSYDPVLMHWDGTSWTRSHDLLAYVSAVDARTPTDVWAVGHNAGRPAAEHWDGSAWTVVDTPDTGGSFAAVDARTADDVWAVGTRVARHSSTVIEHWDGTSWTKLTSDPPDAKGSRYLYSVSAVSAKDAWAVGDSQNHPIVEHWDGSGWTEVKTPHLDDVYHVYGVSALAHDDAWAVGNEYVGEDVNATFAMHWNGTRWQPVEMPAQPDDAFMSSVQMIGPDDVWAVGQSMIPDRHEYRTLIEHWDGTRWEVVPCPNPTKTMNNVLKSVAFSSASDGWAVGQTYLGDAERSLLLHWDGTDWTK